MKLMPKCCCAIEGAGAVDQMKIQAYSLVETFPSFIVDMPTSKVW